MSDFAVNHEGVPDGQGRWVFHLDAVGERVLLADDEGALYWKPLNECKLAATHTPSQPTIVAVVQPQPQQAGLIMPEPNRQFRRNGNN